jgi:hypothetical protein
MTSHVVQVNPSDIFSLMGVYPGFPKVPGVPGFDGESAPAETSLLQDALWDCRRSPVHPKQLQR